MRTLQTNDCHGPAGCQYALRRGVDYWTLVFEGREALFKHELGALYVAYLLLNPPKEPLHAVALALKAREAAGKPAGLDEALAEQSMELEDAAAVRVLWRHQRELERVLEDRQAIEPVKAEALRELEAVTEFLRKSPWLSRHGAERCARAVGEAIRRFHAHLAGALDAESRPDEVLRAFARHLHEYLLVPSGRGGGRAGSWVDPIPAGCFTYEAPQGVVWEGQGLESKVQSPKSKVQGPGADVQGLESGVLSLKSEGEVQSPKSNVQSRGAKDQGMAAVGYLSRFLCVGLAVGLLASGCAGPRPLKGGKAVVTRKPGGVVEQSLVQGENANQATKQDQESVKVLSYTLPAGSRIEAAAFQALDLSDAPDAPRSTRHTPSVPTSVTHQPSTHQPSTSFLLSAPMPVVEREETHARTELGAAQKDTAREIGARLSSLKGIVWVGVGLFVFGLASLVWPPLKVIIGSVTTSAAIMLGGLALMVLPSLIVGNELLILGGVGIAVGGWFLAHRHGELRGRASVISDQ
ncbi:MAG: hypothetical protein NT154_26395 [Verrucomicrobia bacterium]|nr:hypothetical protein [Verrucomicrobiota bacterium]